MRAAPSRVIGIVVAASLGLTSLAPAAVAVGDPPVLGFVQINGGTPVTNQGVVTVSTPATNAVSMRLSSDGISWKTMPWASSTSWDITDPAYGGTASVGRKQVTVQVDDGTDSWGPWDAGGDDILFDNQAPTESQMRVSFEPGRQVSGGLVTMRINWFNDDHAQSGTQSYDIDLRTDGGAWARIDAHPPLPGLFRAVAPGHTYQFRVRGHDYAGNVGGWYEGAAFRPNAYQESSSRLTWTGTWTRTASTSYWGGHARSSKTIRSKAKITFTGRMFAVVARLGSTRGMMTVLVNGVAIDSVPLRSSTAAYRRVVWSKWWPTSASRTVAFKVTSVPGGDWVDIDAILTGN